MKARKRGFYGSECARFELERLAEENRIKPVITQVVITTLIGDDYEGTLFPSGFQQSRIEIITKAGPCTISLHNVCALVHNHPGNSSFSEDTREVEQFVPA